MFRGGSYIDKSGFDNKNAQSRNYMDITDIPGARPKNLFRPRGQLGNAGSDIMNIDPT